MKKRFTVSCVKLWDPLGYQLADHSWESNLSGFRIIRSSNYLLVSNTQLHRISFHRDPRSELVQSVWRKSRGRTPPLVAGKSVRVRQIKFRLKQTVSQLIEEALKLVFNRWRCTVTIVRIVRLQRPVLRVGRIAHVVRDRSETGGWLGKG